MEYCPVTDTLGYTEILWTARDLLRRGRSKHWLRVMAKVEGHEFLAASNNGWLVVYYSYQTEGQFHSGEFRNWLLISTSDREAIATKAHQFFPLGSSIPIRVNPKARDVSIAVSADRRW